MTDPQPLLAALADPTRRAVYERLNTEGPASASRLAAELPISRQAVAKHLSLLNDVGLVDRSERGREVLYSARVAPLAEIAEWLNTVGTGWENRLAKLKRTLESPKTQ